MKRRSLGLKVIVIAAVVCSFRVFSVAQQITAAAASTIATETASAVPKVVSYSGTLMDLNGKPLTGVTGVTFLLYKDAQGGAPLWLETQNVHPSKTGHYSVTLGSATSQGLPQDVFVSGEARWLGVQIEGQAEQPRVLLVAVPYALKAHDAETIGGLPASAFMLAAPTAGSVASSASGTPATTSSGPLTASNVTTSGGTVNQLPLWTTATNIQSSVVTQTGSGATAKIGVGTKTPATTLDVNGAETVRGALTLPSTATATSTAGKNSQPDLMIASVFNSGTATPVNQKFQLQAEPLANNTSSASGTLNLLYGSGTATPAETGLKISHNGQITFAAGQTFPGTGKGTVTSVGLAAPSTDFTVSGSPVTGTGTLTLGWKVVPTNTDTANAIVKRDGSGNFASNVVSANDAELNTINGIPIGDFAFRAFENDFVADQFFEGNGAFMYVGDPGCGSGYAAIGFQGLSGCNNYSLLGNGVDTFINAPTGGTTHFRNGNTEFMFQDSNGALVINSNADGVNATSSEASGNGVVGIAETGSDPFGVWGFNTSGNGYGVVSTGSALVTGNLTVEGAIFAGTKDFRIDHPLDPANKYLYHASVESSEMMNIYTGNTTLDGAGEATVSLPGWFEVLNSDFRYQLTAIGAAAPNLHIAREISGHEFGIAGGAPGMKVSWQVTGVRHDAYAVAHPLVVEQAKPANEAGYYIHPELYGQSEKRGMLWGRDPAKILKMQQHLARSKELSSHRTSQPSAHPVVVASQPPILRQKAASETPSPKK